MKKVKKSIFSFLGILSVLIVLLGVGKNVFAEDVNPGPLPTVNLTVNITNAGVPIPRAQLQTLSFQTAYYKLRTGEFTEDDVNSAVWQSAIGGKDEIELDDTRIIGQGITHTHAEALDIIEVLFRGSYGLLGVINETGTTFSGNAMHSPGNAGLNLSNSDGEAEAKVPGGVTAIVLINSEISNGRLTTSNQLLDIVVIKDKKTNLSFDKTGYETTQIAVSMLDLSEAEQRNAKNYVVEYGQEVTFHIAINKSMLKEGGTIDIIPQSNIVIDSITMPSQQISGLPESLELTQVVAANKLKGKSKEEIEELVSQQYFGKNLNYFRVDLPQSSEDIVLDVTAHLAPEVAKTVDSSSINGTDYGPFTIRTLATGDYRKAYSIKLSVNDKARDNIENVQTPQLSTTGANFVFVSKENLTFAIEAQYVLGKVDDNNKYIYNDDTTWVPFDDSKGANFDGARVLKGGHEFYLGDTSMQPNIPVPYHYWNSDLDLSTTINQSIINIKGLGQNQQYFLYQIKAPVGYEKNQEPYYFQAWAKDEIAKDGASILNSSVSYANIQEFGLNGSIPSYKAGVLEFNAVYVDAPYEQDNTSTILIWTSFIILGAISYLVAYGVMSGAFGQIYRAFKPNFALPKAFSIKVFKLTEDKTKTDRKAAKAAKKVKKVKKVKSHKTENQEPSERKERKKKSMFNKMKRKYKKNK